jgi:hypothetical protein
VWKQLKSSSALLTSDERWGVMLAFEEAQPQIFVQLVGGGGSQLGNLGQVKVKLWFAELDLYKGASALPEWGHHTIMNIMYMIVKDAAQP